MMANPTDPENVGFSGEDSFLELLAETLENLDRGASGQFLQRFFKAIAQLDITEAVSLHYWEQILERRRELSDRLGKPISLKSAIVDVLASSTYLRVPVLMEYQELKRLQINAATDPLTGLYNRRLFQEQFEKELNRAQRYSQNLALVVIDLHQFKEVNDRYGHQRGDALLQTAAETLRKSLRTSDYAFRIGGDEFALLLVQSDLEQASTLARRICANFASAILPMQVTTTLGMDYGIAIFPQDGDQTELLVRVADERLYQMKHAARASVSLPPIQPAAHSSPTQQPLRRSPALQSVARPSPPLSNVPARAQAGERRKWERVTLSGTHAYAQLSDNPQQTARVLDLGYGGVAFETSGGEDLGLAFYAVLHVPILPPVRVNLKRLYQVRGSGGMIRTGCSFVT
jgi:diguanylate cyclase (GGDEF)-like protein